MSGVKQVLRHSAAAAAAAATPAAAAAATTSITSHSTAAASSISDLVAQRLLSTAQSTRHFQSAEGGMR